MTPAGLAELGLGLEYGVVGHSVTRAEWPTAAQELIDDIRRRLGGQADGIEHIGSTAVVGLLAKPIVDIAIRLVPGADPLSAITALEADGYAYRGDAGNDGGHVLVLEIQPWVRVAHLHVVAHDDPQWDSWRGFVARLRADPQARAAYEQTKRELAVAHPNDRDAYTEGKSATVEAILRPG
ncbi:MAG: GrpB family protein [Ilumatobacteraceae bacterium]